MPPQNVALAYGLFWAEDKQAPADSERAFYLPLTASKNLDRGPILGRKLLLEIIFYVRRTY